MVFSLSLLPATFWQAFKEPKDTLLLEGETASSDLPNSLLDQGVFKRKKEIRKCLQKEGTLYLKMTVLPSGSNEIDLLYSTLNSSGTVRCILSLLERVKYPSFSGSKIVRFYAFHVSPPEIILLEEDLEQGP